MSEEILKRIERSIEELRGQQSELCTELGRLSERVEELAGARAGGAPSKREVIEFLDRFRAAEALGEASVGAWIAVSTTDCLRGGLRTVQMREGMHARLLEARLKELGAAPEFELPERVQEVALQDAGNPDKSDAQKVREFVARFPDLDAALKPIHEMADRLDDDQETQSLLRTIAQDERSTLEFLNEACALLNPA